MYKADGLSRLGGALRFGRRWPPASFSCLGGRGIRDAGAGNLELPRWVPRRRVASRVASIAEQSNSRAPPTPTTDQEATSTLPRRPGSTPGASRPQGHTVRARRFCNSSKHAFAAARRHGRPRVAVLLRGVSFRNWGSRDTEGSCCNGTEAPQLLAVRSWRERLFEPLEARGYEVDAFAATYRCSNGRGLVEETLLPALAPRLRGSYVGSEANTSQLSTLGRVLGLAYIEGSRVRGAGAAALRRGRPRDESSLPGRERPGTIRLPARSRVAHGE